MSQSALIDLSAISVLCVDNDPIIRSALRFALERHGCQDVVQTHGGEEALDLCAGRGFDLIICDCQMTPMSGLEFLRELAGSDLGDGAPVIMLGDGSDPEAIETARALGVSAWVDKPVSVQTLIEQVGVVLGPRGRIGDLRRDPDLQAMAERHQARLMAALKAAEKSVQSLGLRRREAAVLARGMRQVLDDIANQARTLGYGLVAALAARATDLVAAMANNPGAAERDHAAAARALGSTVTAMKRVAQNRMAGDGAEAGRKLLGMIDSMVAPVRARMV